MARIKKPLNARGAKVMGIMFLVFALMFGSISVFFVIKGNDLQKSCTEETEAVVVSIRKKKGSGRYDHTKYYPTVVYKVGSETYEHELEVGNSNKNDVSVGDIMEIMYDPDDPEKSCTKKETRSDKFAGGFMLCFSAFQFIAAVTLLVKSKKLKMAESGMMQYQQGNPYQQDYTYQQGYVPQQRQDYQYGPELDEMNK